MEEILQINKTLFFALLKVYRRDPTSCSITYERETPARLSAEVEAAIAEELLREEAALLHLENIIFTWHGSAPSEKVLQEAS